MPRSRAMQEPTAPAEPARAEPATAPTPPEVPSAELPAEHDLLLQHMQHGVVTLRAPDGAVLFYNAGAEAILGRPPPKPPDVAVREGVDQFVRADGSALPASEYPGSRALARGEVVDAERIQFRRPDGSLRTLEVSAAPIRDVHGRLTAAVTVFSDVTQRVDLEERRQFLAEATSLLTATFDYRESLRALAARVVPRFADWCLIDLFEDNGLSVRVAITHRDPARVVWAWDMYKFRGDIYSSELGAALLRRAEPLLLELDETTLRALSRDDEHLEVIKGFGASTVMAVPLMMRGQNIGNILFLTAESGRRFTPLDLELGREVGQRVALAIDNAELYQQAKEAVLARDEFLAAASHELRTPVTALRLLIQSVLRRSDREGVTLASVRRHLEMADQQSGRIVSMLEQLLDVSRMQEGWLKLDRVEFDLAEFVQKTAAHWEPTLAEAGCSLNLVAPAPVRGEWDRSRIEQVVVNLITNAAKYGARRPVEIAIAMDAGEAVLTVHDRGVGIAAEEQVRLFHRFERVGDQTAFEGTGLGLWIVRQIVEAHGGTVSVESQLGEGSTFSVRLPR